LFRFGSKTEVAALRWDVCFGSNCDIPAQKCHVCFTPRKRKSLKTAAVSVLSNIGSDAARLDAFLERAMKREVGPNTKSCTSLWGPIRVRV
jgi:hypothetical protein